MGETDSGRRGTGSGWGGGRHPLLAAAVVAVVCVVAGDWRVWAGLAAAVLLGGAGCAGAGWRRGLAWMVCGGVAVIGVSWREAARGAAEHELARSPGGWVRARVIRDARAMGRGWAAPARLLEGGPAGAKVWWEGSIGMPVAGAVVMARGNFAGLPAARNPGEFDRAAWLRRQGVAAVFEADWAEEVVTGKWAALGAGIRHGFRERVTAGLAENSQEAQVIRAVVIGESPPDADALISAYRNSGTLHVFSVSGLHVAMVGSIGWLVLSGLGVPRKWAVPLLLPLVFGYSWITGNSPPALRSAWMAGVFLSAFVVRRRPDLLNALGAVLLAAMLWDGRMLFQPGVQLSYGVVAAIAVGAAWATRVFAWMARPELHLPPQLMTRWQKFWLGLRIKTAQSLGVSLAAALGSAPLTAYHFGLVTPVSVLAGLVLVPMVFVLLVAALVAVAISPVVPAVARGVNWLNGRVANASVVAAQCFAAIPGGHFRVGRESRPMLLVYDLAHGAGAACFSGGTGGAVLMDCGDRQGFRYRVMPSLRRLGIDPDSVVLSHPDGGHLGGGMPVWEAFPIRQALLPVQRSRSPAFRDWQEGGPAAGIRLAQVEASGWLEFPDGAFLETLHAPDPWAVSALADERVAVFRLHWRGWKLLMTSDAGMGIERQMLDGRRDLRADVIVAGRHRGDLTLCDAFLDAVNPQVIVASNSRFPIEERLAPATLAYWESRGIRGIDQGASGGVTLRMDEAGQLRLEGFLDEAPVLLKRR